MANVSITEEDKKLILNADFLLQKNILINRLISYFGELGQATKADPQLCHLLQKLRIPTHNYKVSKGENYLGLPYIMQDYPRIFEKDNYFAIRNFFWWGHFVSTSLLIKGEFLSLTKEILQFSQLQHWLIDLSEDPWRHDLQASVPLYTISEEKINELPFIKLSTTLPLQSWNLEPNFLENRLNELLHAFTLV